MVVPAVSSAKPILPTTAREEDGQRDRRLEVNRIVGCLKLNPLDILKLRTDFELSDVKKQYRVLSMLVHPDKAQPDNRDRAQQAFSMLNAAKDTLMDDERRTQFQEIVNAAREATRLKMEKDEQKKRKELKKELTQLLSFNAVSAAALKESMPDFATLPEFETLASSQLRETLIENEWKARQLMKEAAEADKLAHQETLKRKAETDAIESEKKEWDDTRDLRVNSWRSWNSAGTKKRKVFNVPKVRNDDEAHSFIRRPTKPEQKDGW